jgi:hypothetical protein
VAEVSNGVLVPPSMSSGDYVEVYLYTVNGGNVTNDMSVVDAQYDGLLGPQTSPQTDPLIIQPTATAKSTCNSSNPPSYTFAFSLYGSQAQTTTSSPASPIFNFTFSPNASSPSLPLTLNIGTVVLQAVHYSGSAVKSRSIAIVTNLTPRATLSPTLVMQ